MLGAMTLCHDADVDSMFFGDRAWWSISFEPLFKSGLVLFLKGRAGEAFLKSGDPFNLPLPKIASFRSE